MHLPVLIERASSLSALPPCIPPGTEREFFESPVKCGGIPKPSFKPFVFSLVIDPQTDARRSLKKMVISVVSAWWDTHLALEKT